MGFIQVYPQAPIEYGLFVKLPKGFKTKEGDGRNHVIQLPNNLYGQNQDARVWNHHLKNELRVIGLKQSAV